MGKIINFPERKFEESFEESLSELMKEARLLEDDFDIKDGIYLSDFEKLEKMVRTSIFDVLTESDCQNSDYFHCGTYVSSIIRSAVKSPPKSFYVIDYLKDIDSFENFYTWQQAADMCFLLCSVFTGRCDHGMMNLKSYLSIGKSLYSTYYSISQKKIGYLMSDNYHTMVNVTQRALKTLSN
jgi:hypothetical protein